MNNTIELSENELIFFNRLSENAKRSIIEDYELLLEDSGHKQSLAYLMRFQIEKVVAKYLEVANEKLYSNSSKEFDIHYDEQMFDIVDDIDEFNYEAYFYDDSPEMTFDVNIEFPTKDFLLMFYSGLFKELNRILLEEVGQYIGIYVNGKLSFDME